MQRRMKLLCAWYVLSGLVTDGLLSSSELFFFKLIMFVGFLLFIYFINSLFGYNW